VHEGGKVKKDHRKGDERGHKKRKTAVRYKKNSFETKREARELAAAWSWSGNTAGVAKGQVKQSGGEYQSWDTRTAGLAKP